MHHGKETMTYIDFAIARQTSDGIPAILGTIVLYVHSSRV